MTREQEIQYRYEREMRELRREQDSCCHEWGDVKYDPEIKREPYGCEIDTQGSDVWFRPSGYRDVEHKRWSRTCLKCGKVEYTKDLVPVKYEPRF